MSDSLNIGKDIKNDPENTCNFEDTVTWSKETIEVTVLCKSTSIKCIQSYILIEKIYLLIF